MSDAQQRAKPAVSSFIASAVIALGVAVASLSTNGPHVSALAGVLTLCAVIAELLATSYAGRISVSAAFVAAVLAVGFLDTSVAMVIPAASYVVAWIVERYRWRALLINVAGSSTPVAIIGAAFEQTHPHTGSIGFVLMLALAAAAIMAANFAIAQPLFAVLDGQSIRTRMREMRALVIPIAVNIAVVAVIAKIYADFGLSALVFVLMNVLVFTYMTRLVETARERTRQYANLSWGVLSSLIRTLNERDSRAARHCAAVAAFSRDIAKQMGKSKDEQELAHTAGLLHDIGKFALSDRVMERGGLLDEADWRSIRRHPEIGADLLQDIGVYGPVAEIVKAHHERVDGRGYPGGLTGEQIPDLAKIVAVAEVYDTLTAPDTYRTPMTSFEALNELRRVSGSQLDARCVEAMAELLAGRGMEYRHADEADFDAELDIERRMNEAAAPSA